MDMKINAWVASTAANMRFALEPGSVIEVCATGPNPESDARSYAKDHTKVTDQPTYVYQVTIQPLHKYEVHKEVVGSVHPDA